MKRLLIFILAAGCSTAAYAHRDRLGKISRAEMTFEDGGTVVLTKNRLAVLSLALQTDAGWVKVKTKDLAGIEYPQLDSIEMTWSTFTSGALTGVPYRCVRFQFGTVAKKVFGEYPIAEFFFYRGKYHHRSIWKKVSPNSSTRE